MIPEEHNVNSNHRNVQADIVRFVQLGQRVSTNFTVNLSNRATFDAVMNSALGGNNFMPSEVAATIGTLFDDAMQVEFGAEGSAVLYIDVPFFTHQRIASTKGGGDRYTDEQRRDYAQKVITWARSMRADEITVQQYPTVADLFVDNSPGENPYRIRIWWD
ncbi:hypothetical protein GCM10027436_42740 [Actinophytocola sediminis]